MNSTKQINNILNIGTDGNIQILKGKDYFYFTSKIGYVPNSIMTKSIKNISIEEIKEIINEYKQEA